ncbi:AAA family ATPase [Klebsiella oxytoca]
MKENIQLLGITEIALLAGVSKQAVTNWRARDPLFPKPVIELASGPIFDEQKIKKWLKQNKRKKSMTHVVSMINLKGGVAKTSTSVALAEVFSSELKKRILVIDLDPQTNATLMLIGEKKWFELNEKGHTLATLFKDALEPDNKKFSLKDTLQKNVSDISNAYSIDLLPSSLDLIDVQDRLASIPQGKYFAVNPIDLLSRAVKSIIDDYDLVIIDCPPNLGIITLNGLRISDGYIIPTIPDHLSTYGIPQIITRIEEFSNAIDEPITPYGIVITKYQANSTVHYNVTRDLQKNSLLPDVYNVKIKQTNIMSSAAEFISDQRTLRQKYGSGDNGLTDSFISLAREIWNDLED